MAAASPSADDALVVFDLGKSGAKCFVFGTDVSILAEERFVPRWLDSGDRRVLDDATLWTWIQQALRRAVDAHAVAGVMITTHGCACALIGDKGLTAPIIDYESMPPPAIDTGFAAIAPPFTETLSPDLPGGLNYAKQIYWRRTADPSAFAATRWILSYPQFWNWKFGCAPSSEVSYLGCHSHLWAPRRHDFSSLVDRCGWRPLFPPLVRAGAPVGRYLVSSDRGEVELDVHQGVHDSNASLHLYRGLGYRSFALISTGTWVIVFNPDCPLDCLDAARDMLANVTIDGEPVATARFMGGREYDVIAEQARDPVSTDAVVAAIAAGQVAVPSFAPGGAFPHARGHWSGPAPRSQRERAAVATLYLVCMSAYALDLLQSRQDVIVDGGLAYNETYLALLATLRGDQRVLRNEMREGTAAGAALMAFAERGVQPSLRPCVQVEPIGVPDLRGYYDRWLELALAAEERAAAATAAKRP